MPFDTDSRNPLVSNRFTHFSHQPHYALSFYAPYILSESGGISSRSYFIRTTCENEKTLIHEDFLLQKKNNSIVLITFPQKSINSSASFPENIEISSGKEHILFQRQVQDHVNNL